MTKLYCYVDETGQDTQGKFFIVVAIILNNQRENLYQLLEHAEIQSGKGSLKWNKSQKYRRDNYLKTTLGLPELKNSVYYRVARASGAYEDLTVLAIAQAVNTYVREHRFDAYRATIIIDGLKGAEIRRFGHDLRKLGVRVHKIRGAKDQNEPIIRLADAIAGLVRQSYLGIAHYQVMKATFQKDQSLREL